MQKPDSIWKKIGRKWRGYQRETILRTPYGKRLLKVNPGERILTYHGIDALGSLAFNSRFISQDNLREQLTWLKENCNILSLADLFEGKTAKETLNIVITFDDGYRNNLKRALPILQELEIPATFFVTPVLAAGYDILWVDHLDVAAFQGPQEIRVLGKIYVKGNRGYFEKETGKSLKQEAKEGDFRIKEEIMKVLPDDFRRSQNLLDYWELLSIQDIRTLAETPGIELGAHGLLHNNLDRIPLDAAVEEMRRSKAWLEEISGKEILSLAYPDGAYSRRLVDEAEKLGYTRQLAVDFHYPEDVEDPRLRDRFGINPHISAQLQLFHILKGDYS